MPSPPHTAFLVTDDAVWVWHAAITYLGDPGVLLTLLAFWLPATFCIDRTAALRWAAVLLCGAAVIVLEKVLFHLEWTVLGNPSGHAAMAALTYGGFGLYAHYFFPRLLARALTVSSVLLVASIAVTRVTLGAHTIGEVLSGLGVGSIGVFYLFLRPGTPPARLFPLPVLAGIVAASWVYGAPWNVEPKIAALTRQMAQTLDFSSIGQPKK